MQPLLEFISSPYHKRLFFPFLFLTILLFANFRISDQPLRSPAAPNGIVSFELAGSPLQAQTITNE